MKDIVARILEFMGRYWLWILAAVLLLLGGTIFHKYPMELTLALAVIVLLIVIFVGLSAATWYAYKISLPRILARLAEKGKFICMMKEQTYQPVERSGKFVLGMIRFSGHRLSSSDESGRVVLGTPSVSNSLYENWLEDRGLRWLGFDAPGITYLASMKIDATRLEPESNRKAGSLSSWVKTATKTIHGLRLSFTMYVLVEDIETPDTHKVHVLAMAEVNVIIPYLTWYGLGGQAYKTIRTRVESRVREIFEEYTLFDLITVKNLQNEAEKKLSTGLTGCMDLGVEINKITLMEWDYTAPPEFKALLESPKAIEAKEAAQIRDLERTQRVAEKDVAIAEAKVRSAEALGRVLEAEWRSVLKQFGGNAESAKHHLLNKEMGPQSFAALMLSQALKDTRVQVLGDGGLNLVKLEKPTGGVVV